MPAVRPPQTPVDRGAPESPALDRVTGVRVLWRARSERYVCLRLLSPIPRLFKAFVRVCVWLFRLQGLVVLLVTFVASVACVLVGHHVCLRLGMCLCVFFGGAFVCV